MNDFLDKNRRIVGRLISPARWPTLNVVRNLPEHTSAFIQSSNPKPSVARRRQTANSDECRCSIITPPRVVANTPMKATMMKVRMNSTLLLLTALIIALPGTAFSAEVQKAEMAGYLLVSSDKVPDDYNAGFSLYAAAWPLLQNYPGHRFQTGLFGTWMHAQYEGKPPEKLYSDIEGGLGWWRDTRFPTETPKFIMGGVAVNFKEIANGPAHGRGTWNKPEGLYGVAQLSPWLLFPIDGLNVKQGTCGDLFGYGYLPLPLTAAKPTTGGKSVATGDNCWTLFLGTKNFKGPVCFFTPYFWSHSAEVNPDYAGLLLDSRPSAPNKPFQMETQYVPAALSADEQRDTYARVAPTSFPVGKDGKTVVLHRLTSYNKKVSGTV